jgi:CxxC motif-containing protein
MIMRKLICIECPKGCPVSVGIEGNRVVSVIGNSCPKGEDYVRMEVENPQRVLTSTVLSRGLSVKMVPVRTDRPIPRDKILDAIKEIKKLTVHKPVSEGDVLVENFLGLDVHLIATREVR